MNSQTPQNQGAGGVQADSSGKIIKESTPQPANNATPSQLKVKEAETPLNLDFNKVQNPILREEILKSRKWKLLNNKARKAFYDRIILLSPQKQIKLAAFFKEQNMKDAEKLKQLEAQKLEKLNAFLDEIENIKRKLKIDVRQDKEVRSREKDEEQLEGLLDQLDQVEPEESPE